METGARVASTGFTGARNATRHAHAWEDDPWGGDALLHEDEDGLGSTQTPNPPPPVSGTSQLLTL